MVKKWAAEFEVLNVAADPAVASGAATSFSTAELPASGE